MRPYHESAPTEWHQFIFFWRSLGDIMFLHHASATRPQRITPTLVASFPMILLMMVLVNWVHSALLAFASFVPSTAYGALY